MGKNHSPSFPSKELYLKVIHMSGTTLGWRSSNHVFPHATPSVAVTGDTGTQTHMQSINNSNCINMMNMHVNRYIAIGYIYNIIYTHLFIIWGSRVKRHGCLMPSHDIVRMHAAWANDVPAVFPNSERTVKLGWMVWEAIYPKSSNMHSPWISLWRELIGLLKRFEPRKHYVFSESDLLPKRSCGTRDLNVHSLPPWMCPPFKDL